MNQPTSMPAAPLSRGQIAEMVARFHRDGFAPVAGVLSVDEAAELRRLVDAMFADPAQKEKHRHGYDFVLARLYDGPQAFRDLLRREPVHGLVTAILGPGCEVVGLNAIRNPPAVAISHWHVDDILEWPVPAGVPRHDPRIRMPVLWLTAQVALTDIDTEAHGPTEFVPGSHYAGRLPNDPERPSFEGRGPVPVLCRTGDAYLQNHQCWHRGAPNRSDRTRYLLQLQYGAAWAVRRFGGLG